jgi:uncharacterized repeat protein (TIGR04076 family)
LTKYKLVLECVEQHGWCPYHQKGDTLVLEDGGTLVIDELKTKYNLCIWNLVAIAPYVTALSEGVDPENLGLTRDGVAYVGCTSPDQGESPRGHGTLIWKIKRLPSKKNTIPTSFSYKKFYEDLNKRGLWPNKTPWPPEGFSWHSRKPNITEEGV